MSGRVLPHKVETMVRKKLLLLGKTGMLSQAVMKAAAKEDFEVVVISKSDGNDLTKIKNNLELEVIFNQIKPDIVFNATGITDLNYCEQNPEYARTLHARLPAQIAAWSNKFNKPWVHVSTDHFFNSNENKLHTEMDDVNPVNEYANSKLEGEYLALTSPQALVLRTNIIGKRGWETQPNFAEWVLDKLKKQINFDGYTDTWASSIEVGQFASLALILAQNEVSGLMNLACSESLSKAEWIEKIAQSAGLKLDHLNKIPTPKEVEGKLRRANAMGLDCSKSHAILNSIGLALPDSKMVSNALVKSF